MAFELAVVLRDAVTAGHRVVMAPMDLRLWSDTVMQPDVLVVRRDPEADTEILEVPLIVILGHDSCGAVTATRESVRSGEMPRGFQRSLVERIMPAVLDSQRAGRDSVDEIVEANVEMVAHRILDQSRSIASAVSTGRVAIVGMCYSLQHGRAKLTFGHGSWLDVSEHGGVEHQG